MSAWNRNATGTWEQLVDPVDVHGFRCPPMVLHVRRLHQGHQWEWEVAMQHAVPTPDKSWGNVRRETHTTRGIIDRLRRLGASPFTPDVQTAVVYRGTAHELAAAKRLAKDFASTARTFLLLHNGAAT